MIKRTIEDVGREVAALDTLDTKALQQRWRELYRTEPPPKIQSGLLRLAVAYRIQEKAFGGLKTIYKRQMRDHLDAMRRAPGTPKGVKSKSPVRLSPGTQLMREWNGVVQIVDVVAGGFVWRDKTYRTLSAVAVAITGTKWSGPKFFGLTESQRSRAPRMVLP
jgi:hypothetical protein